MERESIDYLYIGQSDPFTGFLDKHLLDQVGTIGIDLRRKYHSDMA